MRLAAYAGTSMVLATGVVIRALHQRTNFYSACVYISQSSACIMVLTNLIFLFVCTFMVGLQRLLYGPLRVIEIEQLYEKAWFAITETCLAMTIFREEVGFWFCVMFVSLLIGKVWGWIGEGRVEVLEQQPPTNPRLFHIRLSLSLSLSTLSAFYMLSFSVRTVREQAEPNMMVMFAFEFAVLTVTSLSTALRYMISLREMAIIKEQTMVQLQERRAQIWREREEARQNPPESEDNQTPDNSPDENDLYMDEDVDVPGWEDKGRWVFYLDLATDFFKLVLYLSFFCVLFTFYGMPIHIIRDVAITIRSFYKRINDFIRYRQATRDMNERYPDATAAEIAREDVCIICREIMRPWQGEGNNPGGDSQSNLDARLRPKKLPCGHILHFACLRSWLERQQNCPTCRRPVLSPPTNPAPAPIQQLFNQPARPADLANHGVAPLENQAPGQNRIRFFNFGPFRLGFGAGQDLQGLAQQFNRVQQQIQPQMPGQSGNVTAIETGATARFTPDALQLQLQNIEHQLMQQINGLRLQAQQLYHVRALQGELSRLRNAHAQEAGTTEGHLGRFANRNTRVQTTQSPIQLNPQVAATGAYLPITSENHQRLPAGLTLPEGWTLLPLQRLPHRSLDAAVIPDQAPATQNIDPTDAAQNPNDEAGLATLTQSTDNSAQEPSQVSTNKSSINDHSLSQVTDVTDASITANLNEQSFSNKTTNGHETTTIPSPIPLNGSTSDVELPSTSYVHGHGTSSDADNSNGTMATVDKGKARAVTIEDASDDSS